MRKILSAIMAAAMTLMFSLPVQAGYFWANATDKPVVGVSEMPSIETAALDTGTEPIAAIACQSSNAEADSFGVDNLETDSVAFSPGYVEPLDSNSFWPGSQGAEVRMYHARYLWDPENPKPN